MAWPLASMGVVTALGHLDHGGAAPEPISRNARATCSPCTRACCQGRPLEGLSPTQNRFQTRIMLAWIEEQAAIRPSPIAGERPGRFAHIPFTIVSCAERKEFEPFPGDVVFRILAAVLQPIQRDLQGSVLNHRLQQI